MTFFASICWSLRRAAWGTRRSLSAVAAARLRSVCPSHEPPRAHRGPAPPLRDGAVAVLPVPGARRRRVGVRRRRRRVAHFARRAAAAAVAEPHQGRVAAGGREQVEALVWRGAAAARRRRVCARARFPAAGKLPRHIYRLLRLVLLPAPRRPLRPPVDALAAALPPALLPRTRHHFGRRGRGVARGRRLRVQDLLRDGRGGAQGRRERGRRGGGGGDVPGRDGELLFRRRRGRVHDDPHAVGQVPDDQLPRGGAELGDAGHVQWPREGGAAGRQGRGHSRRVCRPPQGAHPARPPPLVLSPPPLRQPEHRRLPRHAAALPLPQLLRRRRPAVRPRPHLRPRGQGPRPRRHGAPPRIRPPPGAHRRRGPRRLLPLRAHAGHGGLPQLRGRRPPRRGLGLVRGRAAGEHGVRLQGRVQGAYRAAAGERARAAVDPVDPGRVSAAAGGAGQGDDGEGVAEGGGGVQVELRVEGAARGPGQGARLRVYSQHPGHIGRGHGQEAGREDQEQNQRHRDPRARLLPPQIRPQGDARHDALQHHRPRGMGGGHDQHGEPAVGEQDGGADDGGDLQQRDGRFLIPRRRQQRLAIGPAALARQLHRTRQAPPLRLGARDRRAPRPPRPPARRVPRHRRRRRLADHHRRRAGPPGCPGPQHPRQGRRAPPPGAPPAVPQQGDAGAAFGAGAGGLFEAGGARGAGAAAGAASGGRERGAEGREEDIGGRGSAGAGWRCGGVGREQVVVDRV